MKISSSYILVPLFGAVFSLGAHGATDETAVWVSPATDIMSHPDPQAEFKSVKEQRRLFKNRMERSGSQQSQQSDTSSEMRTSGSSGEGEAGSGVEPNKALDPTSYPIEEY